MFFKFIIWQIMASFNFRYLYAFVMRLVYTKILRAWDLGFDCHVGSNVLYAHTCFSLWMFSMYSMYIFKNKYMCIYRIRVITTGRDESNVVTWTEPRLERVVWIKGRAFFSNFYYRSIGCKVLLAQEQYCVLIFI